MKECGVPNIYNVYAGFVLPKFPVKDCPPLPNDQEDDQLEEESEDHFFDRHTRGIVPHIEIMMDDLCPYPHEQDHLLRLSGCCALDGEMARVEAPDGNVSIFEATITPSEDLSYTRRWLHAFPAQANLHQNGRIRSPILDTTWENSEMLVNPFLSEFSFRFREPFQDGVDLDKGVTTLRPELIRVTTELPSYYCGGTDDETEPDGIIS